MNPSAQTVFPHTFFKETMARRARARIKNTRGGKTDYNQRRPTQLGYIAQGANNIDFGMDRVFATQSSVAMGVSIVRDAILTNGEDLATMEDHGDVIALIMLRRISAFLAKYIRINVAIQPCWEWHVWRTGFVLTPLTFWPSLKSRDSRPPHWPPLDSVRG